MRRKQKHGQWLFFFLKNTLFELTKAELQAETRTPAVGWADLVLWAERSVQTWLVDWQRASGKGKCQVTKHHHQIPPTSTFPLGFPLKLSRHPWDILNRKYLFKCQRRSWLWGDKAQKGSFSKNFKSWFHFKLEKKERSLTVALTTLPGRGDGNTGIVENFPPS